MLILRHQEVREVLTAREHEVVAAVRSAYLRHRESLSVLPHSTFLRVPPAPGEAASANRIIGLPAYLGGERPTAGIKWIASFPGNVERGMDRASAVMVLNSLDTGRPEVVLEASLISAARTAASAALAAATLGAGDTEALSGVTLVGCGVINLAVLRYLTALCPDVNDVVLYDRDPARARAFADRCAKLLPVETAVGTDITRALRSNPLVSIATTASTPHLGVDALAPSATVLHVSLRDLTPEAVLASHNVVDDADHVCRESTSLHLAEQRTGHRGFIDAALADVLLDERAVRRVDGRPVVFSPFGLGVLDLAVADLVRRVAIREGLGVEVDSFLPTGDVTG